MKLVRNLTGLFGIISFASTMGLLFTTTGDIDLFFIVCLLISSLFIMVFLRIDAVINA